MTSFRMQSRNSKRPDTNSLVLLSVRVCPRTSGPVPPARATYVFPRLSPYKYVIEIISSHRGFAKQQLLLELFIIFRLFPLLFLRLDH